MFEYWREVLATIANVATVLIAGVALWVAWRQADLAREHNRLSVRPVVQLKRHWEKNSEDSVMRLEMVNNGLGPAKITAIKLMNGSEEVHLEESGDHKVEQALRKTIGPSFPYWAESMAWPDDIWIKPGDRIAMAKVRFARISIDKPGYGPMEGHTTKGDRAAEFADLVKHCNDRDTNYVISYSWESMYGEKWTDNRVY